MRTLQYGAAHDWYRRGCNFSTYTKSISCRNSIDAWCGRYTWARAGQKTFHGAGQTRNATTVLFTLALSNQQGHFLEEIRIPGGAGGALPRNA